MDNATAELYKAREKRVEDAIHLRIPDRVPVDIGFAYFPAKYMGIGCDAAFYDYEGWLAACKKTMLDFAPDMGMPTQFFPGKVLEMLDPKPLTWPGYKDFPNSSHQYKECENMKADEYDAFFNDFTGYMLRTFYPRVSGAMEGFSRISDTSSLGFAYHSILALAREFAMPEVSASLKRMIEIGEELEKWAPKMAQFRDEIKELGFPSLPTYGIVLAPFDSISDHLRGMHGSMLDMYRNPDALLKACDDILEKTLAHIPPAPADSTTLIAMPLHRGAEGFMSIKQFETFYWPTLKAMITRLAERGYIVSVAWEGDYTSRLEYLTELPKGKVLGRIDTSDIFKAKEILGGHMCLMGNFPTSVLRTGTPEQIKEHCKKLIDVVGKDGGYILSTSTPVDDVDPANLKTLIDFTMEYGLYK